MTLKSRAIAFAFCTGAVAFILALFAGSGGLDGNLARALIIAIVCGVMSWASAERAIASYAEAVDDSIERLSQAAGGDLTSPTPPRVAAVLPELARSLDGLLAQVRTNLDTVHSLAMFDPVTLLPNRTHFRQKAAGLLDILPDDGVAALFFIDLDKFKAVNDNFGHAQGDQLLGKVADRLRVIAAPEAPCAGAREPLIGRLAGDEFTLLVAGLGSRDEAERVGDSILDALSEPFELAGQQVEVAASIGVALWPDQGRSLTELMRAADAAMYHAKESGRARCQLFTPGLAARLADNVRLEGELRLAVERGEFTFLFQPQICLASGEAVAAEALLRWRHPRLGMLPPDRFIRRAEETGLIHEIGSWAVEELASVLGRWRRLNMSARLAANISPRQIARPGFFSQVRGAMARHQAPAGLLELEITEAIAMQCDASALAGLARLREEGATVAVDDFGSGYSNLARLQNLPIDRVKIDRALTANLADDEQARAIVQAVIGLIHSLGYSVIADGVETKAQRALLQVAGCDFIQGHAIARPMAEEALCEWLRAAGGKHARA